MRRNERIHVVSIEGRIHFTNLSQGHTCYRLLTGKFTHRTFGFWTGGGTLWNVEQVCQQILWCMPIFAMPKRERSWVGKQACNRSLRRRQTYLQPRLVGRSRRKDTYPHLCSLPALEPYRPSFGCSFGWIALMEDWQSISLKEGLISLTNK